MCLYNAKTYKFHVLKTIFNNLKEKRVADDNWLVLMRRVTYHNLYLIQSADSTKYFHRHAQQVGLPVHRSLQVLREAGEWRGVYGGYLGECCQNGLRGARVGEIGDEQRDVLNQ